MIGATIRGAQPFAEVSMKGYDEKRHGPLLHTSRAEPEPYRDLLDPHPRRLLRYVNETLHRFANWLRTWRVSLAQRRSRNKEYARRAEAEEQLAGALRLALDPNTPEEVLRKIGTHIEWTKSYAVVSALAKNPNTPIGIRVGLQAMFSRPIPRSVEILPGFHPSGDDEGGGGGSPLPSFVASRPGPGRGR